MKDYATWYPRRFRSVSKKSKLSRIRKILSTDLPPMIMVMAIMLLIKND